MVSTLSKITGYVALLAAFLGLILSPIPKNLGFYTFLGSKFPAAFGLTPAFLHGIEWNYTYEKLYNSCNDDIKGQTALITGANSGVGYETAKALARCGVHVTLACRNPMKCNTAADQIRAERDDAGQKSKVSTMTVDTSKLKSVQTFAKEFLKKHSGALDMLYLNAGIGANTSAENRVTEDGVEVVFATNYLGHHLMYRLLEPRLLKSKMARVVQTSSSASFDTFPKTIVATSLEELNDFSYPIHDMRFYGQSKLAQIIWAKHLTKRLGSESNVYVNAAHPGAVDTLIWLKNENFSYLIQSLITYLRENIMWTAAEGALTQIYLGAATREIKSKDIRGKFFHPQAIEMVNPLSLDEKLQEELWNFSDELVAKFL